MIKPFFINFLNQGKLCISEESLSLEMCHALVSYIRQQSMNSHNHMDNKSDLTNNKENVFEEENDSDEDQHCHHALLKIKEAHFNNCGFTDEVLFILLNCLKDQHAFSSLTLQNQAMGPESLKGIDRLFTN